METPKFPPIEPLKFDVRTELGLLQIISNDLKNEMDKEDLSISFIKECTRCYMNKLEKILNDILDKLDNGKN